MLLFGFSGTVGAVGIPLQITGSDLSVDLHWGDGIYEYYDYSISYTGYPGGVLELNFHDLAGFQRGNRIDTTGTVTNLTSSVPEAAIMLLFGTGLIGLAVVGRKKLNKTGKGRGRIGFLEPGNRPHMKPA